MSFVGAVFSALGAVFRKLMTAPSSVKMFSTKKHSSARALKNIGPNATFYANLGLILEKYEYLSSRNKIIHPQNYNGKT